MLVYFLFSLHIIRYIFGGFPVLLLVFFCCYCWGAFPNLWQYASCLLERPSSFFSVPFYQRSGNNHWVDLQNETGSENFQPNYSKLITFMMSTFRDVYQESKRQPLWLPLMIPTPPIPLLLSLSTENISKTDFGLKAKETTLKNMADFNVWKCNAKAHGGCWRDVISAQCSECQSEEIQWSAGKWQE